MDRSERRRRIVQRPNAVRFSELRRLLEDYGWALHRIRGSHHIFARRDETFVVPHRRPHVLAAYVRDALKRCQEDDDDQA